MISEVAQVKQNVSTSGNFRWASRSKCELCRKAIAAEVTVLERREHHRRDGEGARLLLDRSSVAHCAGCRPGVVAALRAAGVTVLGAALAGAAR